MTPDAGSTAPVLAVTTAAESLARDRAAMARGVPSFDLMLAAGSAAAAEILRSYGDRLADGVAIHAGSGNNGGDAYVVAAQLARAGVAVRVVAAAPPRTDDAVRAAATAAAAVEAAAVPARSVPTGAERVVVDGLLGTGARAPLREPVAQGCRAIADARRRGARIVALDLPTGVDADDGRVADGGVVADCTVAFGTIKRGHLVARGHVGRLVLVDIGLGASAALGDGAWRLGEAASLRSRLPPLAWDAHKGRRGRLALVGGAAGMAGATVLAARASLRAGVGLLHAWVDAPSVVALQAAVPQALAHGWPDAARGGDAPFGDAAAMEALAIGPGLGRDRAARAMLAAALDAHAAIPLVLDADALTLVALEAGEQGSDAAAWLRRRAARASGTVVTPHLGEFARLLGAPVPASIGARVTAARAFAARAGVTVLLKGTPTIVASPDDAPPTLVARGTPVLATGGSGDLLTGIVGALLAQGVAAPDAAALGAWVHGVAAEVATAAAGTVRGVTLDEVLAAMPAAWRALTTPDTVRPSVLLELPAPWA